MPSETMPPASKDLLGDLLRDVSRSFYLTLRVLPKRVRPQIGLAYLLARTTDTIADTEILPVADRLAALERLRARILETSSAALDLGRFVTTSRVSQSDPERRLLIRVEDALAVLANCTRTDQKLIREVLATITSGQALDLQRFAGASATKIVALKNGAELDDYTYRVAGCVGEFWTKICRAHLFPETALDDASLLANGIRFGQGLQLVNILRDLPRDLRSGRCYLPLDALTSLGLQSSDLLSQKNESRLRPLYDSWLDRAEAHLQAGWTYTLSLPFRQMRVRLACAWPILIGVETLARLRSAQVLDATQRVKVSRGELWNIMLRSVVTYPLPSVWRKLVLASRKPIASASIFE